MNTVNKMTHLELRQAIRAMGNTPHRGQPPLGLGDVPPGFAAWSVASLASGMMRAADLLIEVRNDAIPERMMGSRTPFVPSREDYQAIWADLDRCVSSMCAWLAQPNQTDPSWAIPLMAVADLWSDIAEVLVDGSPLDFSLVKQAHKALGPASREALALLCKQMPPL